MLHSTLYFSLLINVRVFVYTHIRIIKIVLSCPVDRQFGPYYKSEPEVKSNSSEILPVNCKFICDSTPI